MVIMLTLGIANSQHAPIQPNPQPIPPPLPSSPVVYVFGAGQEPQTVKLPKFSYLGTEPLRKDDKICGAVRYSANGKNLYDKILDYHEKTYLDKGWNPRRMRMLVVATNRNRSFSTSGSVSSSWSSTDSANTIQQMLSKNTTSSLYATGSIAPSFSQSWVSQRFDVWYFLVE